MCDYIKLDVYSNYIDPGAEIRLSVNLLYQPFCLTHFNTHSLLYWFSTNDFHLHLFHFTTGGRDEIEFTTSDI